MLSSILTLLHHRRANMRKPPKLLLILGLLLCCAGIANATITVPHITTNAASFSDGSSLTIPAIGANNAIGVCAVYYGGAVSSTSVPTDASSDVFTLLDFSTTNRTSYCWGSVNPTAGVTASGVQSPTGLFEMNAATFQLGAAAGKLAGPAKVAGPGRFD